MAAEFRVTIRLEGLAAEAAAYGGETWCDAPRPVETPLAREAERELVDWWAGQRQRIAARTAELAC